MIDYKRFFLSRFCNQKNIEKEKVYYALCTLLLWLVIIIAVKVLYRFKFFEKNNTNYK